MKCSRCGNKLSICYFKIGDHALCSKCSGMKGSLIVDWRDVVACSTDAGNPYVSAGIMQRNGSLKWYSIEKPDGFDELPRAVQDWWLSEALRLADGA